MSVLLMCGLGLCEHCGILVTLEVRPTDEMWLCGCGKELTNKSFGYTQDGQKVKWVGSDGKWTDKEPEEDFKLGELDVVIRRPR